MIKFVLCEDEKIIRDNTKKVIGSFMMKSDIGYDIYEFDCYNDKFENLVREDEGFKIYFLDIKTKKGSGIDAARMIREQYDDWVSVIIIMTAFSEFKYEALSSRLFLLDFINKFNDCNRKIKEDLKIALKTYDKKYKTLNFDYNHIYYKIEYRQIVYIEKEKNSKRCLIKTNSNKYFFSGSLDEIEKKLDERFFRCYKSIIINLDQVDSYDIKTNIIKFRNNDSINLISRIKKKQLISLIGVNEKDN